MPLCMADCRYSALKSLGEKKQCFNEYVQQKRNEEKDEERRRLKQVGGVFCGVFSDWKKQVDFSRAEVVMFSAG